MNPEGIYSGLSALAFAGWIALAIAPLIRSYAVPFARIVALLLAAAYLAQLGLTVDKVPGSGFSTLAEVTLLLSTPNNLMMGWTHYLAFDLFIGSWEAEDAAERGIPHWLLIPCLFLTLMVGPVGLLLYWIVRTLWQRRQAK